MNIAVQSILKGLKENGYDPVIATSSDPVGPSAELKKYASADESDLVSEVHRGLLLCVTSLASAASLDSLAAFAQITLIPSFPGSQTQSGRVSISFILPLKYKAGYPRTIETFSLILSCRGSTSDSQYNDGIFPRQWCVVGSYC